MPTDEEPSKESSEEEEPELTEESEPEQDDLKGFL